MKIALVTDKLFVGGGVEHIFQICKNMPQHTFRIFAKNGNAKEKFNGLKNVSINYGYKEKDIKSFNPQIIHFHSLLPLLKLYKLKYYKIVTIHGMHIHKYEFQNSIKSRILYTIRFLVEKYLYSHVDKIITVSDDDYDYLLQKYNLSSTIIHNGIDCEPIKNIKDSKELLRKNLNFPQDKIICATVARFDFPKDHIYLIDAIKFINQKKNNIIFYLVGEGETKSAVELYVKQNKLNNIIFLGNRNDVYDILKASDVFILPSKWEGLPISALEALCARLKLLLSDTYGNRTIKKYNSNNVELFSLTEPEDLAYKLTNLNFEFLPMQEVFTYANMINSLEDIYNENITK